MAKNDHLPVEERFREKFTVNPDSGCWEWHGATVSKGYGRFWPPDVSTSGVLAHRWAYEHWAGPIPPGLQIDHACRNTACVNPAHLQPITARENILRGVTSAAAVNARKTHCLRGHEFTSENTRRKPTNGARICVACQREYQRNWQRARRQQSR